MWAPTFRSQLPFLAFKLTQLAFSFTSASRMLRAAARTFWRGTLAYAACDATAAVAESGVRCLRILSALLLGCYLRHVAAPTTKQTVLRSTAG